MSAEPPPPAANDPVAFMSRHFVALTCRREAIKGDGDTEPIKTLVFSGFIIELHELHFWVTAGHCLKKLDASLESGNIRITSSSFMDSFGHEAKHFESIPFEYEVGCGLSVESPEHGMDFALILLDELKVKAFAKNGVIPIRRKNWVHQPGLKFDFFRILGVPESRVMCKTLPNGIIDTQVGQMMVAVNAITKDEIKQTPPDVDSPPSEDWFVGKLDPECKTQEMAGMSGGPIYGFRRDEDDNLLYYVVALQSRWWRKQRIIFGCSLPLFAEQVHQQFGEVIADSREAT